MRWRGIGTVAAGMIDVPVPDVSPLTRDEMYQRGYAAGWRDRSRFVDPPIDAVCDTCGRHEWWNGRCRICPDVYEGQDRGWPMRRSVDVLQDDG